MSGVFEVHGKVNVDTGTNVITLTGANFDASTFTSGMLIAIDNYQLVEAISGTSPDISGNSTIMLRHNWSNSSVNGGSFLAFNSPEGLKAAILSSKLVSDRLVALTLRWTNILKGDVPTIDVEVSASETISVVPYQYLVNQFQSTLSELNGLLGSVTAMTSAEFFALAENRKRNNAGSGFLEWGKHHSSLDSINEGMYSVTTIANELRLGRADLDISGVSRTSAPIVVVGGVQLEIQHVNTSSGTVLNEIKFPPAPNGTKTYDSVTGSVVEHASSTLAFASETATNKVVTSRKDLVFLEVWHEKISDKDVIYPLGNVQYGASSYDGISLSNTVVSQGYSAFGEWDSETKGYGAIWSSLTTEQQFKFIADLRNNIYSDEGELIQVRYRIRVVEGLGNDWATVRPTGGNGTINYGSINATRIEARGSNTAVNDFFTSTNNSFYQVESSLGNQEDNGSATVRIDGGFSFAHNGLSNYIPIGLVQRLNQGAYHPSHNPQGCRRANTDQGYTTGRDWFSGRTNPITSVIEAFTEADPLDTDTAGYIANSGNIGGVSGRTSTTSYDFFDAIYSGLVEDLRLPAAKLDYSRLLENNIRKAVSGRTRGKGKVPYTRMHIATNADATGDPTINIDVADTSTIALGDIAYTYYSAFGWVECRVTAINSATRIQVESVMLEPLGSEQNSYLVVCSFNYIATEYDSLPWVDIIGDPSCIVATFPDGVLGQWIPVEPDGTSKDYPLNRKSESSVLSRISTLNDGVSWVSGSQTINTRTNQIESFGVSSNYVALLHYESLSDFTELANNNVILGSVGGCLALGYFSSELGNRLIPSLIDRVNISNTTGKALASLSTLSITFDNVGKINSYKPNAPIHTPFDLSAPNNNSNAVKTLYSLTEKNGLIYMQYHGREMIYDVDWGDDNTIPISDGDYTITDDNGNTVKAFCHHGMIPIGIADHTESN